MAPLDHVCCDLCWYKMLTRLLTIDVECKYVLHYLEWHECLYLLCMVLATAFKYSNVLWVTCRQFDLNIANSCLSVVYFCILNNGWATRAWTVVSMSWEAMERAETDSILDESLRVRTGRRAAMGTQQLALFAPGIAPESSLRHRDAPEDAWLLPTELWEVRWQCRDRWTGIFAVQTLSRQILHGGGCAQGKWHQEEQGGGWAWNSDVWRTQMSRCSRNSQAVWEGKSLGLCHWHCFYHFRWLHQLFSKKEMSSQVFPWRPVPVHSSSPPTPVPDNHQSWLLSTLLSTKVSLGGMYPLLQCPPPPHGNMWC